MEISDIRRDNLRQLVDQYKSKAAFGRRYGVDPTYVSQLLNKHRNFGEKAARNMEGKLKLKPLTLDKPIGEGSSVRQEPAVHNFSNVVPVSDSYGRVPLISWVQAGEFCEAVNPFEPGDAEDWLPCPCAHSDRTFAVRVQGDSMTSPYPGHHSYPPGTIIYVDPNVDVTNGCRVVARIDGEATFKTYAEDMGRKYLRPINPGYESRDITELSVEVCGVVIGSWIPERLKVP
ncbi:LexA family protein [Microbulbifer sp. 2304DJ12-6]|uniref:LexA family protein n=1 Tax=Microbulbifer sp. 2304DJ12-6 TaxID=3233340 RepID=UPI0039B04376